MYRSKSFFIAMTGMSLGFYTIFLARIFHTDRDEEAVKADGATPAVGRLRGRLHQDSRRLATN
ncbi:MAG: hypothetical protein QE493_08260 [Verrucomicrobiae bacterium]|nr:hypothetical protein [Verrucomicrobiae bacterium]